MSEKSKISWCDSTVNFWEGCTKVSDGCKNCYAEARDKRFTGGKLWGKGAPRRKSKSAVAMAKRLNSKPWVCDACGNSAKWAENFGYEQNSPDDFPNAFCSTCNTMACFHRRRIFSLSLGDWLDPEVPVEWLAEMLDTIRKCPDVIWILCTKRPELWKQRMGDAYAARFYSEGHSERNAWLEDWRDGKPPGNICLLASVENQATADDRIPELLRIPARWHGLSVEPLLGPVAFPKMEMLGDGYETNRGNKIDWLIIGGESGPQARPCNVDWVRWLMKQGKDAGVPVFVKQLGANPTKTFYGTFDTGGVRDTDVIIKDPKGGNMAEWPEDLRVREFPKGF